MSSLARDSLFMQEESLRQALQLRFAARSVWDTEHLNLANKSKHLAQAVPQRMLVVVRL
jgi:hypothetical protein